MSFNLKVAGSNPLTDDFFHLRYLYGQLYISIELNLWGVKDFHNFCKGPLSPKRTIMAYDARV